MTVEGPPLVEPDEEIWKFCEELGKKYGLKADEVHRRFALVGAAVARAQEKGGIAVVKEIDGRWERVKGFKENGGTP